MISKSATISAFMLFLCSCKDQPEQNIASSRSDLPASDLNNVSADKAQLSYIESKNCFIDTMMASMNQEGGSGGDFVVNESLADTFMEDLVEAGSAVGKDKAAVTEDLRQTVAESSASTGRMSEPEKQRYVQVTRSHALECLQRRKTDLGG